MTKLAIVIGAGGSAGYGLPTGVQLNGRVSEILKRELDQFDRIRWQDQAVERAFREWEGLTFDQLSAGADLIVRGLPLFNGSIDDFLMTHGGNPAVVAAGKVAITAAILNAERSAHKIMGLGVNEPSVADKNMLELAGAWPLQLIGLLSPGIRAENADELFADVTVVNFNYDRCFETIIYYALQRTHAISAERAAKVVNSIRMFRPYGKVGTLPWEAPGHSAVPFGSNYNAEILRRVSSGIHTLHDRHHSDDELLDIRRAMSEARRILFLGFGFLEQNMSLLRAERVSSHHFRPATFATAYHCSGSLQRVFANQLRSAFETGHMEPVVAEPDCTCDLMLERYGREALRGA